MFGGYKHKLEFETLGIIPESPLSKFRENPEWPRWVNEYNNQPMEVTIGKHDPDHFTKQNMIEFGKFVSNKTQEEIEILLTDYLKK